MDPIAKELEKVNTEIARHKKAIESLNKTRKRLENNLLQVSKQTNQTKAKGKKTTAEVVKSVRRKPKKKAEKARDCNAVFKEFGIRNGDMILPKLIEALRGKPIEEEKVKYSKA